MASATDLETIGSNRGITNTPIQTVQKLNNALKVLSKLDVSVTDNINKLNDLDFRVTDNTNKLINDHDDRLKTLEQKHEFDNIISSPTDVYKYMLDNKIISNKYQLGGNLDVVNLEMLPSPNYFSSIKYSPFAMNKKEEDQDGHYAAFKLYPDLRSDSYEASRIGLMEQLYEFNKQLLGWDYHWENFSLLDKALEGHRVMKYGLNCPGYTFLLPGLYNIGEENFSTKGDIYKFNFPYAGEFPLAMYDLPEFRALLTILQQVYEMENYLSFGNLDPNNYGWNFENYARIPGSLDVNPSTPGVTITNKIRAPENRAFLQSKYVTINKKRMYAWPADTTAGTRPDLVTSIREYDTELKEHIVNIANNLYDKAITKDGKKWFEVEAIIRQYNNNVLSFTPKRHQYLKFFDSEAKPDDPNSLIGDIVALIGVHWNWCTAAWAYGNQPTDVDSNDSDTNISALQGSIYGLTSQINGMNLTKVGMGALVDKTPELAEFIEKYGLETYFYTDESGNSDPNGNFIWINFFMGVSRWGSLQYLSELYDGAYGYPTDGPRGADVDGRLFLHQVQKHSSKLFHNLPLTEQQAIIEKGYQYPS